ncbi:ATP-binding protein [Leptolyngbya sp. 7M]|uniref:hybrid sensor histidine kinase/response regulator n=1 Tax=Leptolyngbya sp. 7M TaxID=2812896 RepID=UPI001B8BF46D|nr:ATP-binding protein [Leptolyngbya sp. 7M]QYO65823.1 response regulator [Leptolyngbya sp. 7M]
MKIDKPSPEPFHRFSFEAISALFDLYGVISTEGKIISIGGRLYENAGSDPQLLVGQRLSETVHWHASEFTPNILERALRECRSNGNARVRIDFRLSADEKRPVELFLSKSGKKSGEILILIGGKEVDAETIGLQNGSTSTDQIILAADNADIGLWTWDIGAGKVISTPSCNELFEVSPYEELTIEKCLAVIHPDDRTRIEGFFESASRRSMSYAEEFRVVYSSGEVEWLCVQGSSDISPNGEGGTMTGAVRKITEQKAAAAELARANKAAKKARDEAIQANKAKDFFIAFVSHEIRSSLNAIIGWSKILLTREVDAETRQNALETIERSARTQTKLINDLVDSARVASGKLRLEYRPIDIFDVVRGVVESHRPAIESANIDYRFNSNVGELAIVGDAARLQQVFGNLISNALKFTPPGGWIEVSLKAGAEAVTIDVADSGAGIAAETLPTIFNQFSQADTDGFSANSGLGLGLSIVKILTERHGGHVRAESRGIGKGSKFSVTLPITTTSPLPHDSNPNIRLDRMSSLKPLEGVKILIVEDNYDSREVLQMFLEKNGANVISTESAKSAFRELERSIEKLPDVLISDLAMPDEDGYSLITRIRDLPEERGGKIPAIALSAFANEESRRKAFKSGFDRYATKPFDHDILIELILKALQKAENKEAGA